MTRSATELSIRYIPRTSKCSSEQDDMPVAGGTCTSRVTDPDHQAECPLETGTLVVLPGRNSTLVPLEDRA